MTVNSKKKNGDLWENCQKFAPKSSWSVCTWQVSVDLISYGQQTNLREQTQYVPELVMNA